MIATLYSKVQLIWGNLDSPPNRFLALSNVLTKPFMFLPRGKSTMFRLFYRRGQHQDNKFMFGDHLPSSRDLYVL